MKPSNIRPLDITEIGKLFYELEFSPNEKKHEVLRKIAIKIPWQYSVYGTIELLTDPILRSNSRNHARLIQTERMYYSIKKIAIGPNTRNYENLEEGAFLLSEMGDPHACYFGFKDKLDRIALRIKELYNKHQDILSNESKVQIFLRILAEEEGYTGNSSNYDDPSNSFITKVMDLKKGLPVTLSVLYLLIGRRLGLPIYGTNMPFHFLLVYDTPEYSTFIDPFNGGILLDRDTCMNFIKMNGFEPSKKYLARTSTTSILQRMIRNLIDVYMKNQYLEMVELLDIFLSVLENKS